MIVHITEQFDDYRPKRYYVNTDDLVDPENPIEKLVLDACNNDFCEININVDEKRCSEPNNEFWEDPEGALKKMDESNKIVPDKDISLLIYFE